MKTSRILFLLKIPGSAHYHTHPSLQIRRGRKVSLTTEKITASGITAVSDEQILEVIKDLLSREFVCYGYKKVTKHLQRCGYVINRKKVFRILKENHLLNHTYNYRSPARRVVESIVRVHMRNEVWEMDIKYIFIHGENRTPIFLR
jgi:putative transposase